MTAPGAPPPSGAFVSGGSGQSALSDLNNLNEAEVKRRQVSHMVPTFDAQRDGLWGMVQDILDATSGQYMGVKDIFLDGQRAISDRIDLLGRSGYIGLTMSRHYKIGPGRNRALPFDEQIGPAQHAEVVQVNRWHPNTGTALRDEWCIRLDREGLWQATVSFSHRGDGYNASAGEIVVLKPDLSVYSITTLPGADGKADSGSTAGVERGAPVSIHKMFVVPEPGYYVQVRWWFRTLIGKRTVMGGTQLAQFSCVQWSHDVENTDTTGTATGTIEDDSPED